MEQAARLDALPRNAGLQPLTERRVKRCRRLAPTSKSLARYGKIAAAIAITFCSEGDCQRTKRHEMFEPELQSWHRPCILSARLV